MLEREFERDYKFFEVRKGDRRSLEMLFDKKGLDEGEQRSIALFQTLVSLTRAVQVESTAYCLLDEQDAARSCLKQFEGFVSKNKLNDRNVLSEVSQYNSGNQKQLIAGFTALDQKLGELLEPPEETAGVLPEGKEEAGDGEDMQD